MKSKRRGGRRTPAGLNGLGKPGRAGRAAGLTGTAAGVAAEDLI